MEDEKIRVVQVSRYDATGDLLGNYCLTETEHHSTAIILDEIKEAEIGEKWELELIEMTPAEYSAMPEFEGY